VLGAPTILTKKRSQPERSGNRRGKDREKRDAPGGENISPTETRGTRRARPEPPKNKIPSENGHNKDVREEETLATMDEFEHGGEKRQKNKVQKTSREGEGRLKKPAGPPPKEVREGTRGRRFAHHQPEKGGCQMERGREEQFDAAKCRGGEQGRCRPGWRERKKKQGKFLPAKASVAEGRREPVRVKGSRGGTKKVGTILRKKKSEKRHKGAKLSKVNNDSDSEEVDNFRGRERKRSRDAPGREKWGDQELSPHLNLDKESR